MNTISLCQFNLEAFELSTRLKQYLYMDKRSQLRRNRLLFKLTYEPLVLIDSVDHYLQVQVEEHFL